MLVLKFTQSRAIFNQNSIYRFHNKCPASFHTPNSTNDFYPLGMKYSGVFAPGNPQIIENSNDDTSVSLAYPYRVGTVATKFIRLLKNVI